MLNSSSSSSSSISFVVKKYCGKSEKVSKYFVQDWSQKTLNKHTIQTLLNWLFLFNKEINEMILEKYTFNNDIKFGWTIE